jgi:hypothetical protein
MKSAVMNEMEGTVRPPSLTMLVKRYSHSTTSTVTGHLATMDDVLSVSPSSDRSSHDHSS